MNSVPDLQRAARMAYRVLAAKGINRLPVQPLTLLRACRDTQVLTCSQAAEAAEMPSSEMEWLLRDVDALTFRRERQYVVVYHPEGNPARMRFTLAHELGHRLLGSAGEWSEAEADCFASHLLCPEPVLKKMKEITPERIAANFYVSLSCAERVMRRAPVFVDAELLAEVDMLFATQEKEK